MINLVQPMRSRYVWFWLFSNVNDGCFRVDVIGCHAGRFGLLGHFLFTRSSWSDQYFYSKNNGPKKGNHLKIVGLNLQKIVLIFDLNIKPTIIDNTVETFVIIELFIFPSTQNQCCVTKNFF